MIPLGNEAGGKGVQILGEKGAKDIEEQTGYIYIKIRNQFLDIGVYGEWLRELTDSEAEEEEEGDGM